MSYAQHPSTEVRNALVRLCDALCSWERSTSMTSALVLRESGGFVFRALDGTPLSPAQNDVSDEQLVAISAPDGVRDLDSRAEHWAAGVDNGTPVSWSRFRAGLMFATEINGTDKLMEWVLDLAEAELATARDRIAALRALDAARQATEERSKPSGHQWIERIKGGLRSTECETCGVVRFRQGGNAPCEGPSSELTREKEIL